jgi:hypothetical protein
MSVLTESFEGKADVLRPLGIPALLKRVLRDVNLTDSDPERTQAD